MNIEFIKKCVSFAEGFESLSVDTLDRAVIKAPNEMLFYIENGIGTKWSEVFYPLLLQRAIKGINEFNKNVTIQQMKDCIIVIIKINENVMDSTEYNVDEEELALKYIFEQEKK